jgi:hypothetical protein
MSPERANAYRRVMEIVNELGPDELVDGERDRIRYAADNLIFSRDLAGDVAAQEALGDVGRLCRALVDSGRLEEVTAGRLAEDLCLCGPGSAGQLKAA